MIAEGMKNGEIFRGPPSSSALCSRSIVWNPPMPDPMKTPMSGAFSFVIFRPESSIANCDAATAYWMKTSIFLTSFFSMNCSGSNPLTSAAICAAYPVTSNRVTRVTPDVPANSPFQVAAVPIPSADTSPRPVTTTRLLKRPGSLLLSLAVRLDVIDRFLDARDLLGILVRDLDPELLLEGHHELHRVERVGAEVV